MRGSAGDQPQSYSSGQGSGMSPSKTTTDSCSPPPPSSSSMGRPGPTHPSKKSASNPTLAEPGQDSDSDIAHPDQQNRSRQKKFVKNFKGLPIEETVHKRKYEVQYCNIVYTYNCKHINI